MGKIKSGVLGNFSGAVGPVVGSSWKGIGVMKSKPASVANPRTAKQVAARGKMGNVSKMGSNLLSTICQPLWNRFASQQSGYNAFCSTNIEQFDGIYPTDPTQFVIASGKMEASDFTIPQTGPDEVEVTWDGTEDTGFKLPTDKAYVVVTKNGTETLETLVSAGVVERQAGKVLIDFGTGGYSVGYYVYLAFLREDGTIVSDSSFQVTT